METQAAPDVEERAVLDRIPLEVLSLSLLVAAAAAILFDPVSGLFILAGGAVSALGFLWLKAALAGLLKRERARALGRGLLLYVLRISLIIVVFCIIILTFPRKILAFVIGFSSVVPVFLIEALRALIRTRPWKS